MPNWEERLSVASAQLRVANIRAGIYRLNSLCEPSLTNSSDAASGIR